MSGHTHAFVQYYCDREKDLVETSRFVNVNNVVKGRKVNVKWFNDKTGKDEIYEAPIHFLGCKYSVRTFMTV